MENHTIHHDFVIRAGITKIFEAITKPKHLVNWWPLNCKGIPELNEEYNFFFGSKYDWYGKVIKVIDNKSFHIKTTKADADWSPTSFGFDLIQNETSVTVKFSHTGWPHCNEEFRQSSYCWAILLNSLKIMWKKVSLFHLKIENIYPSSKHI